MSKFNEEKCTEITMKVYKVLSKSIKDGDINMESIIDEGLGNEFTLGCIDAIGIIIQTLSGEKSSRLDFNHTINTLIYQAKQVENE